MSEPRQGRPRRRLRLAAALVCLAAGLLPMWATAKTGGAAPAAPASAAASAAAAKTTLASIVEASAAQDAFEASVRQHLPGAARIDGVAAEVRAELVRTNPQGRFVQPAEVAEAVHWLCLPEAAAITGTAIPIAGGEI